MSEKPESLEEQATQEGYVPDPPEFDTDEEPADDFPFTEPDEDDRQMRTWIVVDSTRRDVEAGTQAILERREQKTLHCG